MSNYKGYEILKMIDEQSIKDGTKLTCDYCHRYVIVYNRELWWGYSNEFNINEKIKYKRYNFKFKDETPEYKKLEQFQLINGTFEIMDEELKLPKQIIENDMPTLTLRNIASKFNELINYLSILESEK